MTFLILFDTINVNSIVHQQAIVMFHFQKQTELENEHFQIFRILLFMYD